MVDKLGASMPAVYSLDPPAAHARIGTVLRLFQPTAIRQLGWAIVLLIAASVASAEDRVYPTAEAAEPLAVGSSVPSVMVSDDETNVKLFVAGLVDLIVLDDPIFAYETFRDHIVKEVGRDSLLWVDRGEDFALFRYGPQRIGFDYLREQGIPYNVVRFVSDSDGLFDSRLSFFINENLALRKGITRRSSSTKHISEYTIFAVVHEDSEQKVLGMLKELTRAR